MKRAAHTNPKLATLARSLDVPRYQAVGLLESLWHFTATQAPRGDVGKWSDTEIAAAIDWQESPEKLLEALVEARWLDRSQQHRLLIHDWADHADQGVSRSEAVKKHGFASETLEEASEPLANARQPSLAEPSRAEPGAVSATAEPEPKPAKRSKPTKRPPQSSRSSPLNNGRVPVSFEGCVQLRDDDEFLGELLSLVPEEAKPVRGPPLALVDVFAWLAVKLPAMEGYSRKDLKRTARRWIHRARGNEITDAAEQLQAGKLERFRDADPIQSN